MTTVLADGKNLIGFLANRKTEIIIKNKIESLQKLLSDLYSDKEISKKDYKKITDKLKLTDFNAVSNSFNDRIKAVVNVFKEVEDAIRNNKNEPIIVAELLDHVDYMLMGLEKQDKLIEAEYEKLYDNLKSFGHAKDKIEYLKDLGFDIDYMYTESAVHNLNISLLHGKFKSDYNHDDYITIAKEEMCCDPSHANQIVYVGNGGEHEGTLLDKFFCRKCNITWNEM